MLRKIHGKSWASAKRSESLQPSPATPARESISSLTPITCPITPENRGKNRPLDVLSPRGARSGRRASADDAQVLSCHRLMLPRQMDSSAQFFLRTHLARIAHRAYLESFIIHNRTA